MLRQSYKKITDFFSFVCKVNIKFLKSEDNVNFFSCKIITCKNYVIFAGYLNDLLDVAYCATWSRRA
jgi:hypothetical protein